MERGLAIQPLPQIQNGGLLTPLAASDSSWITGEIFIITGDFR